MKKKNIYQGLFAIGISLSTMALLSPKGVHLGTVFGQVKSLGYLVLGALFFLAFLLMEALSFRYIFRLQGVQAPLYRTYGYSLADYFFSSLSPGGSAGQPAQLYYMSRDGINFAQAMMSLIVFNAIYHLAMVAYALFSQVLYYQFFLGLPLRVKVLMAYGVLAQLVLAIFQISLMSSQKRVPKLVKAFMKKMRQWKVPILKNIKEDRVNKTMDQYGTYGAYFKKQRKKLLPIFVANLFLLTFSYSIAYWVYRSLGYRALPYLKSLAIQSQLVAATESLPLPGGVGASEDLFYQVYQAHVPQRVAFSWMVLTRTFTYYLGLGLGFISVFILSSKPIKLKVHQGYSPRRDKKEVY